MAEKDKNNFFNMSWANGVAWGVIGVLIAVLLYEIIRTSETLGFILTLESWVGTDGSVAELIEMVSKLGLMVAGVIALLIARQRARAADAQTKIANEQVATANSQVKVAIEQAATATAQAKTIAKQTNLAKRSQNADRYQKSAEMLGHEKLSVREAGVFALKELAETDPKTHYIPVQKLLCSFMRDSSQEIYSAMGVDFEKMTLEQRGKQIFTSCPSDLNEAFLAFSGLRNSSGILLENQARWIPNLNLVYLVNLLGGAKTMNLSKVQLHNANLHKGNFRNADFSKANLSRSYSSKANFVKAKFWQTIAMSADFSKANFNGCSFLAIRFHRAEMIEASFIEAKMSGAALTYVDLTNADFEDANLSNVNFKGATIIDTGFKNAILKFVDFTSVKELREPRFYKADLTGARFKVPIIPDFYWPDDWQPNTPNSDGTYVFKKATKTNNDKGRT